MKGHTSDWDRRKSGKEKSMMQVCRYHGSEVSLPEEHIFVSLILAASMS